jgi:hypothetical protein
MDVLRSLLHHAGIGVMLHQLQCSMYGHVQQTNVWEERTTEIQAGQGRCTAVECIAWQCWQAAVVHEEDHSQVLQAVGRAEGQRPGGERVFGEVQVRERTQACQAV